MEGKIKLISMSDDKPLDSKHINLFKSLHEMRIKRRSDEFQEWLKNVMRMMFLMRILLYGL